MTARRIAIALAIVVLVPVVLIVALLILVQSSWAERRVESFASARLHRQVEVDGIAVKLGWPPRVSFDRLRIANPPWARTPALIDATGLYARVDVLPLFAGRVVIPYLGARSASAGLEMRGDQASWRFSNDSKSPSRLLVERISLGAGRIRFIDGEEKTDLAVEVKGSLGEGGELEATATGTFRGAGAKANARIPDLSPQHEAPIDFSGTASIGATHAKAQGSFRADGDALDIRLDLAGESMKDLHQLFHMVLPDTPPYSLSGHLVRVGDTWTFDPFQGKVGDSDLRGGLTYRTGGARPFLRANLQSKLLDFNDLGPLVGAPPGTGPGQTAAPRQKAEAAAQAANDKILPQLKFDTERWGTMDADVHLAADRVQRPKQLPIESLTTHLTLKDAVLRLDPLTFGVAGGKVRSQVVLDAHAAPLHGTLEAQVQGLQFSKLFPSTASGREALGTLYGRAKLEGHGASLAQLLGTSDGRMTLAVDGGRVSDLLVNLLELDLSDVLQLLGTHNKQVQLRCAAGGFEVKQGVATPKAFVVDTTDSVVNIEGTVSLRDERLDLVAHALPKDPSIFSLRSPIVMAGALRHPKVHPKVGPIAARVAGAVLLAAVNPALAILPFLDSGPGKDTDCGKLLATAR